MALQPAAIRAYYTYLVCLPFVWYRYLLLTWLAKISFWICHHNLHFGTAYMGSLAWWEVRSRPSGHKTPNCCTILIRRSCCSSVVDSGFFFVLGSRCAIRFVHGCALICPCIAIRKLKSYKSNQKDRGKLKQRDRNREAHNL